MNKAELIKELESRLGSRKAASDALTAVVDVIIREVAKGGRSPSPASERSSRPPAPRAPGATRAPAPA